jgi:hypothetical protein
LPNGALLRQYNGANSNVPYIVLTQRFANNSPRLAYLSGHCLFILLYWGETEIHKIKDDSKIDRKKREKNIDGRGPRQNGTD